MKDLNKVREKYVVLIDCSNLIYRTYFVFKHLKNKDGISTGAIYGFFNMLLYYLERLRTNKIILVFDSPARGCWREEIDEQYKQNRRSKYLNLTGDKLKQHEDISFAKEKIYELANSLGIISIWKNNYEADDMIAMFTQKRKRYVKIITADKDMLQLVNDKYKIKIYRPIRGNSYIIYDENKVKEEYGGLMPKQIPLLLAMAGDSTDNVKGIKGFGDKTACKAIIENRELDEIQKAIVEKNKKLVNLLTKIPGEILKTDVYVYKHNYKKAQNILDELQIKKFDAKDLIGKLHNEEFNKEVLKLF